LRLLLFCLFESQNISPILGSALTSSCCKVIDFRKGFAEPLLYCEQNRDAHGFSGMSKLIDFPSSHHAILNIRFGNLEDFDIRFFKDEERNVDFSSVCPALVSQQNG
jgi:hypothetical protein